MLRLITGAAGSGKTSAITREIANRISSGERGICMIVPEQYSHEAERELCAECGDTLSLGAEVLSFSRLAVRVRQETGGSAATCLDDGGRLLCMTLALRQIASRLQFFTKAPGSCSLALELLGSIDELKNACIGYDRLVDAAEKCEGELSRKLFDLALCLESFDAVVSRGHADPADELTRLSEAISTSEIFFGRQIYVDGFTDFTAAEIRVIEALLMRGAFVTICLTLDSVSSDSEHFAPSQLTAAVLLRYANENSIESSVVLSESDREKNSALSFFDKQIFKYTDETMTNNSNTIALYRAPDIRAECENAAARCLYLVRNTGCRWRDIAIATRGFDSYAPQLNQAMQLYGVPIFTAQRTNLMQKPIPAIISLTFEIIDGGWDTESVLTYLKSGLTGFSREDTDLLSDYISLWQIQPRSWKNPAPWLFHPAGYGKENTEESAALLAQINEIRQRLSAPLFRFAEKASGTLSAAKLVLALSEYLLEISLPETLESRSAELEAAGHAQLADELGQVWSLLCGAMEQFSALLGETKMQRKEFSELFLRMLSCYSLATIPMSPDTVTAGEIDRMRRRNIKHLIILGASDDRIPGVSGVGGLLTEDERETLQELGLSELSPTDPLAREFSLIYNCVTLPSETLMMSHTTLDGEGAAAGPCFLMQRAMQLFGTEIANLDLDAIRLSSPDSAFLLASQHEKNASRASFLAYEFFAASNEGRGRLDTLSTRADFDRGSISDEGIRALYGEKLRISPTQANSFFSCKYQYFLRYGLRLNEKERAEFSPPELGSFIHFVLEKATTEIAETVGFETFNEALSVRLADKYTDIYISEELGSFEGKSARFIYLFERLCPRVRHVVSDSLRELSLSDFRPLRFELSFGLGEGLPPIHLSNDEDELFVTGKLDRVDSYLRDGKLYLRVIDYKTGKTELSFTDIWNGMGMQLLLYLFSLEHSGKELFGHEIASAGVLYVPARDAVIPAQTDLSDEDLAKERKKATRRSGLLLNDPQIISAMEHGDSPEFIPVTYKKGVLSEGDSLVTPAQLEQLNKLVDSRMLQLSHELKSGAIDATPCYTNDNDNACSFCPYMRICRFNESRDGLRRIKKLKSTDFWNLFGGEGCE